MTEPAPTPSQTIGPFLAIALDWDDGPSVVSEDALGAVRLYGMVTDGAGSAVPDALIETWQADADGFFNHPDDLRTAISPSGFRGFGRCATDTAGRYEIRTVRPGPLPDGAGGSEAPHIDVSVFARGLLHRLITRLYLPDHPLNTSDPVLSSLDPADAALLVASEHPDGSLQFDIRLQGKGETPFFVL